ncbi:MAG: PfkB family carbohydrate kinase [Pseudomonadota bacterium]
MIVTCGEAMVDLIPQGDGEDAVYKPVPGGSLYTVALGIARLGGRVGYLWELSNDTLGNNLMAALNRAGVDCTWVVRSARPTPVAVVDMSGEEPRYLIADPGAVMKDTPLGPLPDGTECFQVGSAVLAVEPVGSVIEAAARGAPLVSLDINARAPSINDASAYRERLRRVSSNSGIIKASSADIALIGEGDPGEYMLERIEDGAALAILTDGDRGAFAFTQKHRVHRPAVARDVVDPVGAGDSFMAAALFQLQSKDLLSAAALRSMDAQDLSALLDFSQKAAAFTCARHGAAMPAPGDLPC